MNIQSTKYSHVIKSYFTLSKVNMQFQIITLIPLFPIMLETLLMGNGYIILPLRGVINEQPHAVITAMSCIPLCNDSISVVI